MSLYATYDNVFGDLSETLSTLVEGSQGLQSLLHEFYSALARGLNAKYGRVSHFVVLGIPPDPFS